MADLPVTVEVIPAEGLVPRLRKHLPARAVVTVTCLPQHGPSRTVDTAIELAEAGYTAVPHLAARSVAGRRELAGYVSRFRTAGISDVFVIGGDAGEAAGPYAWSGALLADLVELGEGSLRLGVAAYPEGHPETPPEVLTRDLRSKQELASWCVTQLCFSPEVLAGFPARLRADGVSLPVWAGIPGPVHTTKLLTLAGRIGVGSSLGFLRRSAGGAETGSAVRQLLSRAAYDPSPLAAAVDGAGYAGLHVYSFNDLAGLAGSGLASNSR